MVKANINTVFGLIDAPPSVSCEEEWGDYVDRPILIDEANKAFNLADYLDFKLSMQVVSSNNGWTRRAICPFHKSGHERTPSFFVNSTKNIFYCQACGVSGGLVRFIHLQTSYPEERIAEHILKLAKEGGSIIATIDHENKLQEKKKITKTLFDIADLFYEFIHNYSDDDVAIKYVDTLMSGFDSVYSLSQEDTEKNIEEIYKNFQTYLQSYNRSEK